MYLFIPKGGVRQVGLLDRVTRREDQPDVLSQVVIRGYLDEAGFTSLQDARTEAEMTYGVQVEIESLTQISHILSVLGLPDLGYVQGRVICTGDRHADVWLNVAGVECQVEGPNTLYIGILREYFNSAFLPQFRSIFKDFSIAVNRSVRLRRGGRPEQLNEPADEIFTIWGLAAARETDRAYPPEKIFGHHVLHSRDPGFTASGEGVPLMDPDTGWCVAEVFEDHLFIHHNLFSNREDDIYILLEVLERALPYLSPDPEVLATRRAAAEKEAVRRTRAGYIALVNQRFVRTLNTRKEELADLPNRIQTARLELQRLIRQEQSLFKLVDSMRAGDQSAQYEVEFDRIMSLPKVTKLQVNGEKIVVHTTRLFCQNPNTKIIHRLAKMEITVNTKAQDIEDVLRWRSLEGSLARDIDRPAPHVVSRDGKACLGNAREPLELLFAQQEWEQLIHLAIHFVESVNIQDPAGADLVKWPHATPAELIGTEWEGQQVSAAA